MNTCGEDSSFEDGMFGAIKTEKIAVAALLDGVGDNVSSLLRNNVGSLLRMVKIVDFKRVPAAGVGEDEAVECGQRIGLSEGSLGEKQDIVGNVKDTVAVAFKILVGRRCAIGAEDELSDRRVDDRPHRRNIDSAVFILCSDDAFENEAVGAQLWEVVFLHGRIVARLWRVVNLVALTTRRGVPQSKSYRLLGKLGRGQGWAA